MDSIAGNQKELDKQHDTWLAPPSYPEPECEVCGETESIHLTYTGWLCFNCEIFNEALEEGEEW